jgi:predicted AAA+ superfamily ATPase
MTKDEYNNKMTDVQNEFIKKLADQVVGLMKINKETIEQFSQLTNLVKILDNRVKKLEDDNSFDLQDLKKEFNVKGYTNE